MKTAEFDDELKLRLAALRNQGLHRELRRVDSAQSPRIFIDAETLLNFSSNDYLGLANEPALKDAAIEAVNRYGAGAGASRLICGSLTPHHQLDDTIAQFKNTQAALSFSTGYAAALGTICALLAAKDHVNIFLYDGAIVPDPEGIITAGHDNKTARTVGVRHGETINAPALTAMFKQIIANNRAGGWRTLKRNS